jgi:hypothetical protein
MDKIFSTASYPGLEGIYIVTSDGLSLINPSKEQLLETSFNLTFKPHLDEIFSSYEGINDERLLGWLIKPEEDEYDSAWPKSSTLKLTTNAFDSLSSFEIALANFMEGGDVSPNHPLTQGMSIYEGMRKISIYGLALGFTPILLIDKNGHPVILKLSDAKTNRDFKMALRELILNSHLFEHCKIKPFINELSFD